MGQRVRLADNMREMARRVKVDVLDFDSRFNPVFVDRLYSMEDYFEWYGMINIECVRFAKIKLIGSV